MYACPWPDHCRERRTRGYKGWPAAWQEAIQSKIFFILQTGLWELNMMPEKISIVIVDDHPMLRHGLISMFSLHSHIKVIGDYGSADSLMKALAIGQPDILLLDLSIPDISGEDLAPKLLRLYPKMKIIILTGNNSAYSARMLLDNGVQGYLLKNSEQHLLLQAITNVQRGFTFISPELQDRVFRMSKQIKNDLISAENLTNREIQVLRMIANEQTSQQIADELGLSLRTVENYRMVLMQKLGAKNMIGMVKKGIMLGLIE